jgi:hypothetical protein
MNPIERSVARSEKAMTANNRLESLHRNAGRAGPPSMRSFLGGLKHGETVELGDPASNGKIKVSYHERQSHGDNGQPVRGATTGEYTVEYPNGKTSVHAHGPHANTAAAAKKGANPNAKPWAAGQAHDAVVSHLSKARLFNDKRPVVTPHDDDLFQGKITGAQWREREQNRGS